MVALLERLTGIHSAKGVFAINAAHKGLTRSGADAIEEIEVEHPVICAHPAPAAATSSSAACCSASRG